MAYFRCDFCDWPLWFSDVNEAVNEWGWILSLQHHYHIHSVRQFTQFCDGTAF